MKAQQILYILGKSGLINRLKREVKKWNLV